MGFQYISLQAQMNIKFQTKALHMEEGFSETLTLSSYSSIYGPNYNKNKITFIKIIFINI